MSNEILEPGRRKFFKNAAALSLAGSIGSSGLFTSCSGERKVIYEPPLFPETAPNGEPLKAGLIGCGGRGTGAAINFINAGPNLKVTALADLFQDKIDRCRAIIKQESGQEIPDKNCFVGFDAYKQLIDTDVDLVIHATATHFRPIHFKAAVEANKHCFIEKPAAVDPVGVRSVIASGKRAESYGLTVVAGTQRRYQDDYNQALAEIRNGAIGDLISASCYYKRHGPGQFKRESGWSDMEAMIRNRANWRWLTGDSIVNLMIHNIDGINWFFGMKPIRASGMGGRYHRPTGDMYDFFNVEFVFEDNRRYNGICREMDGCSNQINDLILGTKGYSNGKSVILDYDGNKIWEYKYPIGKDGKPAHRPAVSPYDQEMICLVDAIRRGVPINQAEELAHSTLTGIMGRESAYSGKDVTWAEMLASDLRLGPEKYEWGDVNIKTDSPIPGRPSAV